MGWNCELGFSALFGVGRKKLERYRGGTPLEGGEVNQRLPLGKGARERVLNCFGIPGFLSSPDMASFTLQVQLDTVRLLQNSSWGAWGGGTPLSQPISLLPPDLLPTSLLELLPQPRSQLPMQLIKPFCRRSFARAESSARPDVGGGRLKDQRRGFQLRRCFRLSLDPSRCRGLLSTMGKREKRRKASLEGENGRFVGHLRADYLSLSREKEEETGGKGGGRGLAEEGSGTTVLDSAR